MRRTCAEDTKSDIFLRFYSPVTKFIYLTLGVA